MKSQLCDQHVQFGSRSTIKVIVLLLKAFDMHKKSESKNNLGQIDQGTRTRKELETAHVKPLHAARGFHQFAEGGNCSRVFLCAQFDWPTARGRVAVSHFYLCQMPLWL